MFALKTKPKRKGNTMSNKDPRIEKLIDLAEQTRETILKMPDDGTLSVPMQQHMLITLGAEAIVKAFDILAGKS